MESLAPLLPEGFDVEKHLTPRYRPWQQRIAIVPEGDLFAALREGRASIVTDTIETFTENGHPGQLRRGARGRRRRHAPPASTCRCSATSPSPSTASRSTSPPRVTWRGHHDQRRPEHGLRLRLLPPQLDAARGPGQRPGRAPARAHAGQGRGGGRADAAPRGRRHAAAAVVGPGGLQRRLRHALAARAVQAGRPRAVDAHAGARAGGRAAAEGSTSTTGRSSTADSRRPRTPRAGSPSPARGAPMPQTAVRTGVTLNYEISGEGDPLLLVMGTSGAIRLWGELVPRLAERYRVIAFDNRGLGGSERGEGRDQRRVPGRGRLGAARGARRPARARHGLVARLRRRAGAGARAPRAGRQRASCTRPGGAATASSGRS